MMALKKTISVVTVVISMVGIQPLRADTEQQDKSPLDQTDKLARVIVRHDEVLRKPESNELVNFGARDLAENAIELPGGDPEETVQHGVVIVYHKTTPKSQRADADQAEDKSEAESEQPIHPSNVPFVPGWFSFRTWWQDPSRRPSSIHPNVAWGYHPPSFAYHPKRSQRYEPKRDWRYTPPRRAGYRPKRNRSYHRR